MSFTLRIDAPRWRRHLHDSFASGGATASVVPVVKGGGYGIGAAALLAECRSLGAGTIAVGTVFEAQAALEGTDGDVLVLEPFEPRDAVAAEYWARVDSVRTVRTISSAAGLDAALGVPGVRIVLEGRTSMSRFGFAPDDLAGAVARLRDAGRAAEGLALHEPLAQPRGSSRTAEVAAWGRHWSELGGADLWVSHLSDDELQAVHRALPAMRLRLRIGTRLWLGDRGALRAQGTVLAVHTGATGAVGYRQRSGPAGGTLLVVSGGTSHGIGLEGPSPAASLRQRAVAAGTGALDAAGRALSPFSWQGKQRWFAEPPHQQVSMIWLPKGCPAPAVGDQLDAEVRFTTSQFDAVLGLDSP